jgi:hypothetical protein
MISLKKFCSFLLIPLLILNSPHLLAQKNIAIVYAVSGKVMRNNKALKRLDTISYGNEDVLCNSFKLNEPDESLKLFFAQTAEIKTIGNSGTNQRLTQHIVLSSRGPVPENYYTEPTLVAYSSLYESAVKIFDDKIFLEKYFKGDGIYWNWGIDSLSIKIPEYPANKTGAFYIVFHQNGSTYQQKVSTPTGLIIIDKNTFISGKHKSKNFDYSDLDNCSLVYRADDKETLIANSIHLVFIPAVIENIKTMGVTDDKVLNDFLSLYFANPSIAKKTSQLEPVLNRLEYVINNTRSENIIR